MNCIASKKPWKDLVCVDWMYRGTQNTAHSTQNTVHSTQHTAHCTQHTAHSTQHTAHSTLHTAHSTLHTQIHMERQVANFRPRCIVPKSFFAPPDLSALSVRTLHYRCVTTAERKWQMSGKSIMLFLLREAVGSADVCHRDVRLAVCTCFVSHLLRVRGGYVQVLSEPPA
jgi:hypothetical protein